MAREVIPLQNAEAFFTDKVLEVAAQIAIPGGSPVSPTNPLPANDLNLSGSSSRTSTTIANGAAATAGIDLSAIRPRGGSIITSSAWTVADLLPEISLDNVTFFMLKDEFGTILRINNITTNAAFVYTIPPKVWNTLSAPYFRVRSVAVAGTADANQGAARALTILWVV